MAISTTSFNNTPQAGDDLFLASGTGLTEDSTGIVWLAVMANDLGGAAKTLYSLDDGSSSTDLLTKDTARTEALSTDTSAAGAHIWITADGRVGYDSATLDPAFVQQLQQLNAGEVLTDSFTYAIRLGNGTLSWATAVVQFAGANDAPVVTGTVMGNTVEDGAALTLDALAHASDVDSGSVLQVVNVPSTLPPGVSYDAASHSFTLDPGHAAYQHLAAGQVQPVTVLYGVSDGTVTTQASVTFSVTGTNDAAQIGAPTATAVTEDTGVGTGGLLAATGTLAVADVDDGEAGFQTAVDGAAGNLGSLALGADGSYTYSVANADVQFLGAGQAHEDQFTVRAIDGTSKVLTFTVTGVNDAAVIGEPTNASVTEDTGVSAGALGATGSISVSDADQGQSSFQTTVTAAAGALGSLTLASDGSYSYAVTNADVQFLGATDTHVDTFTVTALDGTTKQVSFTIHGTNDAAVIGDPTNADVTEDVAVGAGSIGASGTLAISDADQGQASFQTTVTAAAGALGSLTLASDGSYSYSVANADVQFLGASDTHVDTFTVTALDGTTKEVSFTIHGANDAAVIGTPTVNAVTEDAGVNGMGNLTATGTLPITDPDQGQAAFQTTVTPAAGALGSLALAADGSYTYTVANAAVQALGATDTHVDSFIVTALDGTARQVDFTVQGANDLAAITGTATGSVQEDTGVAGGLLTTGGTLTATDADAGQSAFQPQASVAGTYGTFSLTAGGAWTYSVSNSLGAVQGLDTGESLTDSFTASSQDGSASQLVTVTIQGLDDVTAGTIGNDTYSFSAAGTGVTAISDPGGTDTVSILGGNTALSVLDFERVGTDLQIQVNSQSITVLDHYGAGGANAMEQITFAAGQTFAGYALAGTYRIDAGADSIANTGNSNDVVAGTSLVDNPIDGGGGASGNDLLFGNGSDDSLFGSRGNDLLVGGAGNDRLQGGDAGSLPGGASDNDVLVGGAGNDTFVFNTALSAANNVDHVFDFQASATDTLLLSKSIFSNLATPGSSGGTTLQAGDFQAAAGAATALVGSGVHVLFDTSTGNLYYDSDGGNTASGRTLFATLDLPGLTGTVDASDFKVGL